MNKKHLIAITFIAAIAVTAFSSCRFGCAKGSGHQVTESRKVTDFKRIDISGGFKVHLKQDSSLNVTISADDNLMKYIRSTVDGDRLHIFTRKNLCSSGEMVINIGVKNLEELKGSGAVEFDSDGKLVTKDLHIRLSGAGKIDLDLDAADVITDGSGSTDIVLRGQASSHNVTLTGRGDIDAFDFVVGEYTIETTGASDCKVNVLHKLNVHSTGASDVKYKGNPTDVNTSKTGASSVTKVD